MAADGPDNHQKPNPLDAVKAGSDVTQGADTRYQNMMAEVQAAQQSFGTDQAGFNRYTQKVADGLTKNGMLEENAEVFAKSDIRRFATSDEKHIKYADMNPQFGHNALESAFLGSLRNSYVDLQERAGKTWIGNTRDEFGAKELDKVLGSRQHDRDVVEQQRMAREAQARDQATFDHVTSGLLKNDGNSGASLYGVLDTIKSGKPDGEISRGDLRRFKEQYAERAGRGDFGFTPENLDIVRTLDDNWNKPMGIALRGMSPRQQYGRGSEEQPQPNSTINLDACSQALHTPREQLFTAYAPPGARPGVRNVDADAPATAGAAPIPDGQQFDAAGNPIGARPQVTADATPAPVAADATPAPGAAPPGGDQQFDAAGNPIGAAAPGPDSTAASGAVRRPIGADGKPAPLDQATPAPAAAATPGGNAYDDYYGARQQSAGAPAPGDADTQNGLHRRPKANDGSDAPPPAAGAADATPKPAPGTDAAAAPAAKQMVPDIEHMPDLQLPEIKAGDDPSKIAQDFQKAAIAHFAAAAVYTVKPGQGWDRVARDTMRKSGEDTANEGKTEQFSDQIAKMNGLQGRLDKSRVLHPGDQVQVRSEEWVKAQVDAAMAALQQKMTDASKPGGDGKPAAAATDPTDLYGGQRNGEGDITPTPATTGDAGVPAPKADATATPAPGADATPAPKADATATPAPGADATPAPKADASATPPPGDTGPVPIPKSADGKPLAPAQVVDPMNVQRSATDQPPTVSDNSDDKKKQTTSGDIPDIYGVNAALS